MPQYPYGSVYGFSCFLDLRSYFFFCFPYLSRLAEYILKQEFFIPTPYIEAVNAAFDLPNSHVILFISAQNSKLIHVFFIPVAYLGNV